MTKLVPLSKPKPYIVKEFVESLPEYYGAGITETMRKNAGDVISARKIKIMGSTFYQDVETNDIYQKSWLYRKRKRSK